ncbi:MAG: porin [Rhizobiales bacterium]|nr:porin [Hyphomicrobiales bacterium]
MKMVKSLILGTAVAFAASAGAQAADLPVKAKAAGYVKICPQYGPGFYYIPGTDICLKVGGLVFAEAGYHASGSITNLTYGGTWSRDDTSLQWRSRGYVSMDARTATPYGVLRSFILGGFEQRTNNAANAPAPGAFVQYAFIQFAGFTAGTANSFFDFGANYLSLSVSSNPWNWTNVFAYTANLGNGLSASISLEDSSTSKIGPVATIQSQSPSIVGNIRLDQAWGSAQVMAAAQEGRFQINGTPANNNDWGWAIGAGVEIKLPMLGAGDTIKVMAVTSEGATEYTGLSGSPYGGIGGVGVGFGTAGTGFATVTDWVNATGVNTGTDASSVMVQYKHNWTPTVNSNVHVGYNEAYNVTAAGGFGGLQIVQYGHSLKWSPVKDLTLALDVLYTETDVNNVETDKVATWFRVTRTF